MKSRRVREENKRIREIKILDEIWGFRDDCQRSPAPRGVKAHAIGGCLGHLIKYSTFAKSSRLIALN